MYSNSVVEKNVNILMINPSKRNQQKIWSIPKNRQLHYPPLVVIYAINVQWNGGNVVS